MAKESGPKSKSEKGKKKEKKKEKKAKLKISSKSLLKKREGKTSKVPPALPALEAFSRRFPNTATAGNSPVSSPTFGSADRKYQKRCFDSIACMYNVRFLRITRTCPF